MSCILVAGLGNPGARYEKTRHNIGFMVLDILVDELNLVWQNDKKFQAHIAQIHHSPANKYSHYKKIYFMKPQTFMNASGEAIVPFMRYYNIESLLVIHDEIDIPLGNIYFKDGGSSGGHNGLKSIDSLFGTQYTRLRFGIGKSEPVTEYVLSPFSCLESSSLPKLISHAKDAILAFCAGENIQTVRNRFTLRNKVKQKSNAVQDKQKDIGSGVAR